MDADAARKFDRERDFAAYWNSDPVAAAAWVAAVYRSAAAFNAALEDIQPLFAHMPLTKEQEASAWTQVLPFGEQLLKMGTVLCKPLGALAPGDAAAIGWRLPEVLPAPLLTGTIRNEPANDAFRATMRDTQSGVKPLERMLTLEVGGVKRPLVTAFDPLESFGADLSVFENAFRVAVRAWPDRAGRLFVREAAPVMSPTPSGAGGFAQGRLFSDGPDQPVVLRVTRESRIAIGDAEIQDALRPFIGTAAVLYGNRGVDKLSGQERIEQVAPDYWLLCRLTDPKDDAAGLAQAPAPSRQEQGCLCVGGTPPWNWQGPNVRTHILAPPHAAALLRHTERRVVYGHALSALPAGVDNPYPEVRRVFAASYVSERDTDNEAHWATRLAPVAQVCSDLGGIAWLTSASELAR
jgi:hypothetical protein